MLFERLTPDFVHEDSRGCLTQLVHAGYAQFNIISSKAGVSRGGHYHKDNAEAFYILSGEVQVRFAAGPEQDTALFSQGAFFRIDPYVAHWFFFVRDTVLVSMYSRGVELPTGGKDIFPCEDCPAGQELP